MRNYTHLSITDRRRFYTFLEMGLPIFEMAKRLSKHCSTLYRELNRNSEMENYLPKTSQLKAKARASQKRLIKVHQEGILRDYIIWSLQKG